jgi:biotin carboxylase
LKHILIVHTAIDPEPYTLDQIANGFRFSLLKKQPDARDEACFDRILTCDFETHFDRALAQVRQLHAEDPIDGVTSFSETGVLMASFVARDLGLPCNLPDAALRARNKYLMRRALQEAHLPVPEFHLVHTAASILALVSSRQAPMVLKPLSGSSSYGVIRIDPGDCLEEIEAHLVAVQSYIRSYRKNYPQYPFEFWLPKAGHGISASDVMNPETDFLLEGFIDGQQISVDGIVSGSEVSCFGVIEIERIKDTDYFLEFEEWMPSHLGDEAEDRIRATVRQAVRALGLTDSCFHCELKINEKGIFVIEIAARRGADNITDFLKRVMGVNIYEEGLRIATGERRFYGDQPYQGAMHMRYFLPESSGNLLAIHGIESVRTDPRLCELHFEFSPGATVLAPPHGYEFLGYLSVFGRTLPDAHEALEKLYPQIKFEIDTQPLSQSQIE